MPSALPRAGADLTLPNRFEALIASGRSGRRLAHATTALRSATSATGLSVVFHVALFLVAGLHSRAHAPAREAAAIEIAILDEPAPPPPAAAEEEPPPSHTAAPLPENHVAAPGHHNGAAPRAVAATETKPTAEPPADAPPALTGDDALPHFTIATSVAAGNGGVLAKSPGAVPTSAPVGADDDPYAEAAVDVPARPARRIEPRYPFEARASGVEASVNLEIVLSNSGAITSVRAMNHTRHGFEREAIAAAQRTPFTPAEKHGKPVAVRMVWVVRFELD